MRRLFLGSPVLGFVVLSAVVGCGGEGQKEEVCGEGARRTARECAAALSAACGEYAEALCAKRLACNGAFYQSQVDTDPDVPGCERKMKAICVAGSSLAGAVVTPDGLLGCAAAMKAQGCESFHQEAECVLAGTRAAGEACRHKWQCESGACSTFAAFGSSQDWECGVCSGGEGTACVAPSDCGAGLYCSFSTYACLPKRGVGEACAGYLECADVLDCVGGACTMGPDAGEACVAGACNRRRSLYCDMDTGTCALGTIVGAEEACGKQPDGTAAACDSESGCSAALLCEPLAGPGGTCKESGPFCAFPAVCESGTCVSYVAVGEACEGASAECRPPSACVDGVCRVPDTCP